MPRLIAALFLAGLMLLAAPARAADETWTRYSYPEAGFSVEFPASPRFSMMPDTDTVSTDRRKFVFGDESRALLVLSVATRNLTIDDLLETAQDVTSSDGRTLLAQKVVTRQGISGIESVVKGPGDKGLLMLHQVFFRDGRMIQFIVVVDSDADLEALGRRFLESVVFLPE